MIVIRLVIQAIKDIHDDAFKDWPYLKNRFKMLMRDIRNSHLTNNR